MASLTAGHGVGVLKGGINIVKYQHAQPGLSVRGDLLLESLLWILADVQQKKKQRKAVISFSTGKQLHAATSPRQALANI
jgi:hypothetical protein